MTNEKLEWENYCVNTHRLKVEGGYLYLHIGNVNNTMCFVPDAPKILDCLECGKKLTDDHNCDPQPNGAQDGDIQEQLNELRKIVSNIVKRQLEYHNKENELLNKVAELSMKLSKMQSDLREFEKQKVDVLRDTIHGQDIRVEKMFQRIEKLETHVNELDKQSEILAMECLSDNPNALERIEKLESKTTIIPDFDVTMKQYEGICGQLDIFSLRIQNLEQHKEYQITENRAESKHLDEIEKRIEKLESIRSNDQVFHDELVQHEHRIKQLEQRQNPLNYTMPSEGNCT